VRIRPARSPDLVHWALIGVNATLEITRKGQRGFGGSGYRMAWKAALRAGVWSGAQGTVWRLGARVVRAQAARPVV